MTRLWSRNDGEVQFTWRAFNRHVKPTQWIRLALPFYEEEAPNLYRFCRCRASTPYSGLWHVTSVWGLSHNSIGGIEDHPGAIYPVN